MQREFTVVAQTDLSKPAEFEEVVRQDRRQRLPGENPRRRPRRHRRRASERSSVVRLQRPQRAVSVGVVKQATANPLDARPGAARRAAAHHQRTCRRAWRRSRSYDNVDLHRALDQGGLHARSPRRSCWSVLIIFVFLRSLRATLIPLVTIPVVADRRLRR
jgi:multidrug efflux pump